MFENGSEFLRFDCHLHTNKDKEFKYDGEEDRFVTNYVTALDEQKIGVAVITNHNKFDFGEYKAIKKVANKKEILVLPGVELSVKEGANAVHMLIVFNPDDWLVNGNDYISRIINSFFVDVANCGDENKHCDRDIINCILELNKMNKDYFIIFAHVEQDKGFWKECGGAIISDLSKKHEFKERVLGFQKVRTYTEKLKVHNWMGYDIASVEGSDPKSLNDIGKGEKSTYLKIGERSYAAVKYALKDFENRVFEEIPPLSHGYIKSVKCIGGKFDGNSFDPAIELNTLIGIRGSGKSSILEVIRYGLELKAAIPDKKYKDELVNNILGSGGEVELTVIDKYNNEYTVKRILNETSVITDFMGNLVDIPVNSLLNNPLYFGQKDLALTRAGYEMELLNKIVGSEFMNIEPEIKEIVGSLIFAIQKLKNIMDVPDKITDIMAKNNEIEHKLKIYKEKGVDEKLKKQTACNNDLVKLDSVYNRTKEMIDKLELVYSVEEIQELSLDEYVSEYNGDIFAMAKEQTSTSIDILRTIGEEIKKLQDNLSKIGDTREKLIIKIDSLKEEFAEIKREINDNSIDIDSYVKYQKQISSNSDEIKRLELLLKGKDEVIEDIKELFNRRKQVIQNRFNVYKQNINEINQKQAQLKLSIKSNGSRDKFIIDLKTVFKGTGLNDMKYNKISEEFMDFCSIIEDYYLNNGEKLHSICSDSYYLKVSSKIEDSYEECLNKIYDDDINIKYHDKELSRYSLGQRASALIFFILTQNDSDVIIIDQPEDDLDNQVIYNELIKTIKREKKNMQFIFATHNANIPVLGDAERVATVEYDMDNDKILIEQGTIDAENSHKSIISIMEGGEDAFKRRNEIYKLW